MPDKTALESSIFIRTLNVYMNGEENQAVSESVVTIQPSLRSSFAPLLLQRENQSHAVEARAQRRAQRVEWLPIDILFISENDSPLKISVSYSRSSKPDKLPLA